MAMGKEYRDHVAGTEKHVIWHAAEEFASFLGRAHCELPGEMFVPDWMPNDPEMDCVYNSLLKGTQCIWLTGDAGGIMYWTVEAYEKMLASCSTLFIAAESSSYYSHGEQAIPLIKKYLTPLTTWRVDDSLVRHSDDGDYGNYAVHNTSGLTSVLYVRPDDVLLVVVKNETGPSNASVTVKTTALGVAASQILVFNTVSSTMEILPVSSGEITLTGLNVQDGPVICRLLPLPTEVEEVWHDYIVWSVTPSGSQFTANGLASSLGYVYFYIPSGNPASNLLQGGALEWFDANTRLAKYRINFD